MEEEGRGEGSYLQLELELWHHREKDGGVDAVQLQDKLVEVISHFTLGTLSHHQCVVEELWKGGRKEGGWERKGRGEIDS